MVAPRDSTAEIELVAHCLSIIFAFYINFRHGLFGQLGLFYLAFYCYKNC